MSDARPITNITDFVCGSCWNGFSRADSGVVQGDQLVCPHCGTPLADENPDEQLAEAVRNAPRVAQRDSAEFETKSYRDTSEFAATDENAVGGWLPPEQRAGYAEAHADDFEDDFDSGVLVGDPDHDFSAAERTLSGAQDDDALLAAVRSTSPIPKAFVVGDDELSVATDEPTPVDVDAMGDLEALNAVADEVAAQVPDADLAHRDWKLKAMGITYNFHGLDPLFSWAANKSGQPMSLSHDGEIWKDFHTFYASIRDGVSVKKAFESAPDPGNAPPPPTTPRVTRTINQLRPELPELEGLRPPPDVGGKDIGPSRSPSTTTQQPSRTATNPANPAPRPSAPAQPTGQPSGSSIRPAAIGTTSRNQASLGPSSSPSKRMPVAAAAPKPMPKAAIIGGVVVFGLLVIGAVLHVSGVVRIPGLP